jgi:hypothetical protein
MSSWDIAENPLLVLGGDPNATRLDLERKAQKLLAELALDRRSALTYETPLGPRPRTAEAVRAAIAELRDPDRRLLYEALAAAWLSPREPRMAPLAAPGELDALLGLRAGTREP